MCHVAVGREWRFSNQEGTELVALMVETKRVVTVQVVIVNSGGYFYHREVHTYKQISHGIVLYVDICTCTIYLVIDRSSLQSLYRA